MPVRDINFNNDGTEFLSASFDNFIKVKSKATKLHFHLSVKLEAIYTCDVETITIIALHTKVLTSLVRLFTRRLIILLRLDFLLCNFECLFRRLQVCAYRLQEECMLDVTTLQQQPTSTYD